MGAPEARELRPDPAPLPQDFASLAQYPAPPAQDPVPLAQDTTPLPCEVASLPQDLVFVDLETTGGNAAYHRITEIGIVRVEGGSVVEEWSSLINPECAIPAYIESFTGITNEMVATAPRFADVSKLVLEKLRSARSATAPPVFVAHNARFDYAFLRAEFRRLDMHFSAKVLCTVKLSRRLFPHHVRHSLDAVMERHDLACSARHRALGDARVISEFWGKLGRELPRERLAAAAHGLLRGNRLPAHLPEGLAEELPEGPGVYRFYGLDDVPLYVGKSSSLRTGVLGHFAGDRTGSTQRKLKEAVRRIDWVETAGELGALLREIEAIGTLRPLYNRHQKSADQNFTVRVSASTGALQIPAIEDVERERLTDCFGLFHSAKDARRALIGIARAHMLCLKALGLEQSEGSCFAYQVGKCKGACVEKEPLILHAVRVQIALAALKLKAWPFPGRVALRERDSLGGADWHVVDHWCYLGTARSEDELSELAARRIPACFDARVYRILTRYFASHPQLDWHDLRAPQGLSG
jgi:DNA polymerase III subunit epsilon